MDQSARNRDSFISQSDVVWKPWSFKSSTTRLLVWRIVHDIIYWSFVMGIHRRLVDSAHKILVMRKRFWVMTASSSWRIRGLLQWRRINVVLSQTTGHSIVCLTAYADPHQINTKFRITDQLWWDFTSGFPAQKSIDVQEASMWRHRHALSARNDHIHVSHTRIYRQASNISRTKKSHQIQTLTRFSYCLVVVFPNPLKPDVKSRMKTALRQLHLSDR